MELDDFQELMRATYGERDRVRGTAATVACLWIAGSTTVATGCGSHGLGGAE
ncbi:hypothetical protein BH18ACT4_BH18ACT4_09780 [soil metagenome]